MEPALERAVRFLQASHPTALAAFLGGSAGSGRQRATSDLDIVVVLDDRWCAVSFVQTSCFEGQLVEAFVYGRQGLERWLDHGRRSRRPVVDRLIAEGVPLLGVPLEQDVGDVCRKAIAAGPAPLSISESQMRRYALSALVDDLDDAVAAGDAATISAVAWATWTPAAELALLSERRWLGSGKWLVRELRRQPDRFGLLNWATMPDPAALAPLVRRVLDAAGGYLQDGMLRGERPHDLG